VRKLKVTFDHMNIDVWGVIKAAEYGAWTGEFRYPALSRDTRLVVDTRNVIRA
jgi:hypothetical protein